MEKVEGATQGHDGARDGERRRARHRQESRRHHPHQQRLQGRTTSASSSRSRHPAGVGRKRCRRDRHERAARKVDADHARKSRADERAWHQGAGHARRRGADAPVCRGRSEVAIQRPALLRARCVCRSAHDGPIGRRDQSGAAEKRADVPGLEAADDVEDLIGEEAKLGIRKAARPRKG